MAHRGYSFGKAIVGNLIIIITALVVFVFIFNFLFSSNTTPKPAAAMVQDKSSSAREVCKQFIEKSGYRVTEWGESWNWTTTNNNDGTWSVVMRFVGMPPGGGLTNMTVVCITKNAGGDQWALDTLGRMQ